MSDYLPEEVWIDIFTRLQVKSLLRIRSVCKFFHRIINNPSFISDHITSTKRTRIPLVRYLTGRKRIERKEHYLLLPDDMDNMQELDFPFKSKSFKHFRIVGSCNGLICLSDSKGSYLCKGDSAYGIILWNPSIKKYLTLPKPLRSHGAYSFVLGFGFDLKSGSWRNCNAGAAPYGIWKWGSSAYVNGAVHWIGYSPRTEEVNHGQSRDLIVSFDINNEVFKEMNLPDDLEKWGLELSLGVLGNKLAAIQYHSWKQRMFSVWVMEEYGMVESWREMYDVDMMGKHMKFVGFTNNGDILVEIASHKLVLYDHNDLRYINVGVRGAKDSFHMETYMESLVLLDGESAVSQSKAITCEGEAR
ncbi:F-box kelch-repeat At3g23880-like [Olea europaea subsp. europaea]|uniref:F-box kelch-repeat At3g23880-like n=1 Tax=Olea europaea subsp. europaea TaxID=158383 RepID=A0A8S0V224_OLEEU|nr:F-box kelch-repeat At3g23880-like [Olea europaea subsp. europaea]